LCNTCKWCWFRSYFIKTERKKSERKINAKTLINNNKERKKKKENLPAKSEPFFPESNDGVGISGKFEDGIDAVVVLDEDGVSFMSP
jgi:hypothetical protein